MIPKFLQADEANVPEAKASSVEEEDNEDDEAAAVDMDAFLENLDEDSEAAQSMVKKPQKVDSSASASGDCAATDGDAGILATRTYDLNITYDNYYRTPRLWLTGYDEVRIPLAMTSFDINLIIWFIRTSRRWLYR